MLSLNWLSTSRYSLDLASSVDFVCCIVDLLCVIVMTSGFTHELWTLNDMLLWFFEHMRTFAEYEFSGKQEHVDSMQNTIHSIQTKKVGFL